MLNLTSFRVPLVDKETGIISREWYNFFVSLLGLQKDIIGLSIQPPVTPAVGSAVPQGATFFFIGAACPSGYAEVVALRSAFPRGMAAGGTAGTTGGSATHTHTASTGNPTDLFLVIDGTGASHNAASSIHGHAVTVNAASSLPPYVDGLWCQKT